MALPFGGPYHASKFGIEAVADCFRQELRPWGIDVSAIEPGSIDTPIWERGEQTADELAGRCPRRPGGALRGDIVSFRKAVRRDRQSGASLPKRSPARSSTR